MNQKQAAHIRSGIRMARWYNDAMNSTNHVPFRRYYMSLVDFWKHQQSRLTLKAYDRTRLKQLTYHSPSESHQLTGWMHLAN